MRLQDNRGGYFNNDHDLYTTEKDKLHPFIFINRWKLEPKQEDMKDYFNGILVEPEHPIVFYVDNAFPENWRSAIKPVLKIGIQHSKKQDSRMLFKPETTLLMTKILILTI